MTERCCESQGDATVFGERHECEVKKEAPAKRESLASLAARASYVLHRDPDNIHPYEDRLDAVERGQC